MSRFLFLAVCVALAAPMLVGEAQSSEKSGKIYTWVDKNGRRHYSDQPSAPNSAKPIDVRVSQSRLPAVSASDAETKNAAAPNNGSEEDMTRDWEQGANPGEKVAPNKEAACTVAQKNHRVLSDQSRPAYKRDAAGKPVELTGDDRQAAMDRAQSDVDAYCK